MTQTDILLSSLSMDLYRIAQSAHRGSTISCQRFIVETDRWIKELENVELKPSIRRVIEKTKQLKTVPVNETLAEYALVYSQVLKNQVIKNY